MRHSPHTPCPVAMRLRAPTPWWLAGWVALLAAWVPCPAASPRTGDIALTTALGVQGAPWDDDYGNQSAPSVALDFHWTARNSLRGTLGLLQLPSRPAGDQGALTGVYVALNVSHNWFGGRCFPFVTGGVGVYGIEENVARAGGDDGLEVGINGGGGLETRLADSWTLRPANGLWKANAFG